MGFSRQEYWSGLPFPSPGYLPDPGIEPRSPALQADALTSEPPTCNSVSLWRRQWHPTPVLLPGKSHGQRSLVGYSPWGREESDTTERLHFPFSFSCIGEGNGDPLQCSCLENPRDGGAWWAAIYGVPQSWTRLKWLSSSSSSSIYLLLASFNIVKQAHQPACQYSLIHPLIFSLNISHDMSFSVTIASVYFWFTSVFFSFRCTLTTVLVCFQIELCYKKKSVTEYIVITC